MGSIDRKPDASLGTHYKTTRNILPRTPPIFPINRRCLSIGGTPSSAGYGSGQAFPVGDRLENWRPASFGDTVPPSLNLKSAYTVSNTTLLDVHSPEAKMTLFAGVALVTGAASGSFDPVLATKS